MDTRSLATPNSDRKSRDSRSKTNPELSTPVTELYEKEGVSPETPLSEVKDMLLQLKQAGLSVNDLIKLKQGNLGWDDVEKRR